MEDFNDCSTSCWRRSVLTESGPHQNCPIIICWHMWHIWVREKILVLLFCYPSYRSSWTHSTSTDFYFCSKQTMNVFFYCTFAWINVDFSCKTAYISYHAMSAKTRVLKCCCLLFDWTEFWENSALLNRESWLAYDDFREKTWLDHVIKTIVFT